MSPKKKKTKRISEKSRLNPAVLAIAADPTVPDWGECSMCGRELTAGEADGDGRCEDCANDPECAP